MCLNRTILWLWCSVNHVMSHMQPPSLSSWKQPTYLPFIHQFLFWHVHLYHLNSFIKWDHCWYSLSSNLFVRENKSKSREQINAFNDFVVHLFFANITEPVSLNNICLFISLDITELPAIFLKFWHRVVCSLFNTFFGFLISFPLRIELCLSNIFTVFVLCGTWLLSSSGLQLASASLFEHFCPHVYIDSRHCLRLLWFRAFIWNLYFINKKLRTHTQNCNKNSV